MGLVLRANGQRAFAECNIICGPSIFSSFAPVSARFTRKKVVCPMPPKRKAQQSVASATRCVFCRKPGLGANTKHLAQCRKAKAAFAPGSRGPSFLNINEQLGEEGVLSLFGFRAVPRHGGASETVNAPFQPPLQPGCPPESIVGQTIYVQGESSPFHQSGTESDVGSDMSLSPPDCDVNDASLDEEGEESLAPDNNAQTKSRDLVDSDSESIRRRVLDHGEYSGDPEDDIFSSSGDNRGDGSLVQARGELCGMQYNFTMSTYEKEKEAWEKQIAAQARMQSALQHDPSLNEYQHVAEWSWSSHRSNEFLERISKDDPTLGVCMSVPADCHRGSENIFSDSDLSMIRLIDYCDMNPVNSRKSLDGLMQIIREESRDRGFDPTQCPSRHTVSEKVKKKYGMGKHPQVARITVSSETASPSMEDRDEDTTDAAWRFQKEQGLSERYTVNCMAFSVRDSILDLLDDMSIFGDLDNLAVNRLPLNPFGVYQNQNGYADEVPDGTWYADTIERMTALAPERDPFVPGLDFLLPLILYCDKTGTSLNQRYPLEPFLLTTAIIKRCLRNYPRSWRIAGYIPDLETKSSAERAEIGRRNKGATSQSYHLALGYVLKGFQQVQDDGIVTWLRLGTFQKKVRLRVEIAFIVGDGKSADMLTCRLPGCHPTRRISRCCRTLQQDCDQVLQTCSYINKDDVPSNTEEALSTLFERIGMTPKEVQETMPPLKPVAEDDDDSTDGGTEGLPVSTMPSIEAAVAAIAEARDILDQESFHPARNAFLHCEIRFGLDPRGVWGANPIDLMHAFQSGIVRYVVKMAMDKLAPKKQVKLDRLVHRLFHNLRCREKTNGYPRINFSKGFSKLTMITSDEWIGKLFVLFLVLQTREGTAVFDSIFGKKHVLEEVQLPEHPNGPDKDRDYVREQIVALEAKANELEAAKKARVQKNPKPSKRASLKPANKHRGGQQKTGEESAVPPVQNASGSAEDDPESMLRKCSCEDFLELAEALLSFHAWYKTERIPIDSNTGKVSTDSIRLSIQKLLALVRFFMPREKGCGWRIQKFHDILHLADDIERFGSPRNFDAGPQESGLRTWAKLPALTSQTRGYNVFVQQVAQRTYEYLCFCKAKRQNGILGAKDRCFEAAIERNKATQSLAEEDASSTNIESSCSGKRFRVYQLCRDGPAPQTHVCGGRNQRKSQFHVHPVIEDFLRKQDDMEEGNDTVAPKPDRNGNLHWELHTEATISCDYLNYEGKKQDLFLIRADPDFKKEGPWYDWVMVDFEIGGERVETREYHRCLKRKMGAKSYKEKGCAETMLDEDRTFHRVNRVPCKVLAVTKEEATGEVMVLVHACCFRKQKRDQEEDSCLTEVWQLNYACRKKAWKETTLVEIDGEQRAIEAARQRTSYFPELLWVSANSITAPCFVVEENPGIHEDLDTTLHSAYLERSRILLVRDHARWGQMFTW